MQTIAVLYATRGGLGDVGKFVISHALKGAKVTSPGYSVKAVAISQASIEGTELGHFVDVTDKELESSVVEDMKSINIAHIDIEAENAQAQLEEQLKGVDAVVACLGNR